jgi:hypothetical protein
MNNPVWLKVVCIGAIVLGALGLVMAATGIVGQLMAEQTQASTLRWMEAMQGGGGLPPQVQDIQRELMTESARIQHRWRPISLAISIVHFFVAAALLAGGIQALRMKESGRKLLLGALATTIVFEVVRLPPTALVQWEMSKLMGPYMQRLMDASAPQGAAMPPAQRRTMQTVMRSTMVASVLIGFLTALGMAVVKIAFYVAGVWLLRQPHVRARYAAPLAAEVVN